MAGPGCLNVTLQVAASAFVLEAAGGCSRFEAGLGVVSSRRVDLSAALFQREHRCCSARKKILTTQLHRHYS